MCGIVGYVGPREVRQLLLQGLEKLEYRGYDSAGISVLDGDRIDAVRAVGNLSALRRAVEVNGQAGVVATITAPAPGTVNMWDEYNKWKRENPQAQEAALRSGLIGSPETIRKKLRRFRTSHIYQVILLNQAGKNTHEHICESLELFAKEVMPEFQHDPEHEAWKASVMCGDIQLEEIDTAAFTDRYGKLASNVAPARSASAIAR